MADTDYVSVAVTAAPIGATKPGFGTWMYLSYTDAPFAGARSLTFSSFTAVATAFTQANGPEQLCAKSWFGQTPQPQKMIIGRGANKPTKTIQLSAIAPGSFALFTYLVNVQGTGVTTTQVTFTSDASPTDAEWAAGMVTALNAVVGKNYTAAGATSPITLTGTAPGDWFALEIVDVVHMTQTETTADPGVGADILAIDNTNKSWYALGTGFNSKAYSIAAAGTIEAMPPASNRIYVADTADGVIINSDSTGTADLMDQVKTNAYKRTSVHYKKNPAAFYAAGLAGANLTFDPGQETWALREVAGVGVENLTDTQRARIVARNGNSYEAAYGLGTSFNGMNGNASFLDTRRATDFIVATMSLAVFLALRPAGGKLPETDNGYVALGAVVRGVLFAASTSRQPIVDPTTIVVTLVLRADVSVSDINARIYAGISWSATVQGAVHKVPVSGALAGA